MPEVNGYEVLELLRTSNVGNSRSIPVIVATASGSCQTEDFLTAGFSAHLTNLFLLPNCWRLQRNVSKAVNKKRKQTSPPC